MQEHKIKNLFLRQSYLDSWLDYENSLVKNNIIKWNYIILTASNEEQAESYRLQINQRLDDGQLPKSIHYYVLPDPGEKRVGSGGATLNAIKYVKEHAGDFKNKRILVIHSGGDSKRVPQYSACGKLFSPVPRQLPDGRRSTLFDEFIIAMSGVPGRIKDGMLVLSGDVLLLFNPVQIDFQFEGAAAISIKENIETGQNHGVFLNDGKGNVKRFLHKISIEELIAIGAVNEQQNVDLDTGAVLMDSNIMDSLYSLIKTPEDFSKFVNDNVRLSFYGDFLYPLAQESTLEQYYNEKPEGDFTNELKECRTKLWEILNNFKLKMLCLSPAEFIHFGTTSELLNLVTTNISNYEFLDWTKKVATNIDNTAVFSSNNSFVESTSVIGQNSYIEDSYILGNTTIGNNCVISNIKLADAVIPDNTVIHGLKLKDGRFVVRKYATDCNPKENDYWNAKIYPACDTMEQALIANDGEKMSLCQSFNNADTNYILNWQK
ncbi:MAG: L-fucokinase, partial [bacterium]